MVGLNIYMGKIKKFYERNKVICTIAFIILLIIAVIYLCIHMPKSNENSDSDVDTSIDILFSDKMSPKTTIESPDITKPTDVDPCEVTDGHYICYSNGFSVDVPEGYNLYNTNTALYFINSDTDTEIILKVTDETYEDSISVWEDVMSYVYRFSYLHEGEFYDLANYGAAHKDTISIGNFEDVRKETVEAWLKDNEYEPMVNAYYTSFHSGTGAVSDDVSSKEMYNGVIMLGLSGTKTEEEIFNVMTSILASINPYTPTEEDRGKFGEFVSYHSKLGDETEIEIPADWTMEENSDGMVTFSAPQNSIYRDVKVQFMADNQGKIVNDYAQFSESYEREILSTLFCQDVGDTGFDYTNVATNIEIEGKIRNKDSIIFKIKDTVQPSSTASRNSLLINKTEYYNTRYTFKVGSYQCMLNFLYTNEEYANDVIKAVTERISIK